MGEQWRKLLGDLTQELELQSAELRRLRGEVQAVQAPAPQKYDRPVQEPKYLLDTSWSLSRGVSQIAEGKEASSVIASWMTKRPTDLSLSTSPTLVQPAFLLPEAAACETQEMLSLMEDRGGFVVMQARQRTRTFVQQKPWYVINPDTSPVARVWQGVVAASLLWVAIVTPVQVGLIVELGFDLGTALGFFVDFIFFIDMILQFFTSYLVESADGVLWEVDLYSIACHYLKTWFLLDFLTVFPFDLFVLFSFVNGGSEWKSIKVLRALRLLKLMRLWRASRFVHQLEIPLSIPYQKVALARFLVVLMLVCHWVACFWSMALNLGDGFEKNWYDTLEVSEGPRDSLSTYVAAFYFACYTITSVGFGDVVPKNVVERSMCSAILIVSGLAWAYILSEVGAIVSDMTSESQEFRRRMHHLNVMMQEQSLPAALCKKLRSFFFQNRHHWVYKTRQKLLDSMSPQLQNDVCMKTQLHWLRKVTVFEVFMRWIESKEALGLYTGSFYACVADVTRQLQTAAFAQQEIFANVQVLYILSKGLVMLNKKVGAHGEVWGEDFVLSDRNLIRPIAGTALTYIEVYFLTREGLMDVIERSRSTCPQLEKIVRRYCVRLAVYRGIVAEARRRATVMQRKKAERHHRVRPKVVEVPPEIPPSPSTHPSEELDLLPGAVP